MTKFIVELTCADLTQTLLDSVPEYLRLSPICAKEIQRENEKESNGVFNLNPLS